MESKVERAERKLALTEEFCELTNRTADLKHLETLGILEVRYDEIMGILHDMRQDVFDGQTELIETINDMLTRLFEVNNFIDCLRQSLTGSCSKDS